MTENPNPTQSPAVDDVVDVTGTPTDVAPVDAGRLVVAVDGPSGSGKSSVSKQVARALGAVYLDTGAMYRAAAWHCVHEGVDLDDADAVTEAVHGMELTQSTDPDTEHIAVGGQDVTEAIRTPEVTAVVSQVACIVPVREILQGRQREEIERAGRIVAEGRDITTVVAPDAEVRILMVASEEARMQRRGAQLGGSQNAEALRAQVVGRDAKDSTVVNFSTAADGVITLDNSDLNLEQSVQAVMDLVLRAVPALA